MNSQWKTFLETQSAHFDESGEVQFNQDNAFPECALFDLTHLTLVTVSGDDAKNFLQGQFTNDIRNVTHNHSQLSSLCTPKGRMLSNFRVLMRDEDYLLQIPLDTHQTVMKRLPMFVLMSKVTITDSSDELVRIGLAGACADSLLSRQFPSLPKATGEVARHDGYTLLRLPGATPRFEVIGETDDIISLWQQLAKEATPSGAEHWSLLDIQAGIPAIYKETVEAFVPQMTNMHLIDGVSFTKGCYTGQEVVARMKYLGKLKRRMYLAHTDSGKRPIPGDELFSTDSTSGQGAGKVVDARPSPDGGYELLAVMEISGYESDSMHLESDSGPKLKLKPLPYTFNEE